MGPARGAWTASLGVGSPGPTPPRPPEPEVGGPEEVGVSPRRAAAGARPAAEVPLPPEPSTQKPRPRSPYRFSEPLLPPQPLVPGAVDADGVHLRTCPLCEAMCGMRVEWGRTGALRASPPTRWSQGHLCPKGPVVAELHEDPERLRRRLVKRGGEHVEVSWEEAFEEAWRLLQQILPGWRRPGGAGFDPE